MRNIKLEINDTEAEVLTSLLDWAAKNGKDQSKVIIAQNIASRIKKLFESENLDNYLYLTGLDDEALEYFFKMKEYYDLNLYASFSAVINGHTDHSLDQCFDYYYIKNSEKRPKLFDNTDMVKKIFTFVYRKMKAKNYKI